MFVTRCRENVLYELDGRPALEIIQELYEQASPRDQKLLRSSLFLGLEMKAGQGEYHQGDFLIRNLSTADQETGALVVAARPQVTQVVQFHLRDAQTSSEDLEQQLTRYRSRTPRAALPEGALLFSCLGRGMLLYGHPDHDTEAFQRHLGDVPLTGFFCNGEIGPVQDRTFLHGYTSAYGLFRARPT
jgi:small ligand-binding sensory domain FIST